MNSRSVMGRRIDRDARIESDRRQLRRLALRFRRAHAIEAAVRHELQHAAQLVALEPHAVVLADVDDDSRHFSEVHAVHDLVADRAVDVTDLALVRRPRGHAAGAERRHDGSALLAIAAQRGEIVRREPGAGALVALVHRCRTETHGMHVAGAPRALERLALRRFGSLDLGAAVRAELRAEEHRTEARRARDDREA
jgi:hypothetical protein